MHIPEPLSTTRAAISSSSAILRVVVESKVVVVVEVEESCKLMLVTFYEDNNNAKVICFDKFETLVLGMGCRGKTRPDKTVDQPAASPQIWFEIDQDSLRIEFMTLMSLSKLEFAF